MKNFTYFRPTTAEQAVTLLEARWGNTEMLAGGTDLLALQKEYIAQPGRVVSLNGIAGLQTIVVGRTSVSLGAGVTLATIANHADLRRLYPALTSAATCASATAAGTSAMSTPPASCAAANAAAPSKAKTSITPSSRRTTAASLPALRPWRPA